MANTDMRHFIELRKSLTQLRDRVESTGDPLDDAERDIVAIAQAEALADLAATLNAGISVSTDN